MIRQQFEQLKKECIIILDLYLWDNKSEVDLRNTDSMLQFLKQYDLKV